MDSILAPDPPISPFLISFQVTSQLSSFQGFCDELDNLCYLSPPIRHALAIGSPLYSLVISQGWAPFPTFSPPITLIMLLISISSRPMTNGLDLKRFEGFCRRGGQVGVVTRSQGRQPLDFDLLCVEFGVCAIALAG